MSLTNQVQVHGGLTGAASTVDTESLTASRALVSNSGGKVAVSVATLAEVAHLAGATGVIQTQLNLKAPLASPEFTGTPVGISKGHVGLSNVDNTADTAKPVSTATTTALNLKATLASPTFTGTMSVEEIIFSSLSGEPAANTSSGVAGTITIDDGYIYICFATNQWKRVALNLVSWY